MSLTAGPTREFYRPPVAKLPPHLRFIYDGGRSQLESRQRTTVNASMVIALDSYSHMLPNLEEAAVLKFDAVVSRAATWSA